MSGDPNKKENRTVETGWKDYDEYENKIKGYMQQKFDSDEQRIQGIEKAVKDSK